MQWKRPQGGHIPFGEAVVTVKGDTTADSKVGALDKSSAREAVSTKADHVRDGDWHTMQRTAQIVAAADAASASSSTQPTQRASVINPLAGIFVSLDVASDDDRYSEVELIDCPSSTSEIIPRVVYIEDDSNLKQTPRAKMAGNGNGQHDFIEFVCKPACRGVRSCSRSTKACGAGSGSGDASKGSPASSLAFRLAAAASRRLCEMAAAI